MRAKFTWHTPLRTSLCFTVEKHILLWEILSDMKLIHLAMEFCVFRSEPAKKKKIIKYYTVCWTLRGIKCGFHLLSFLVKKCAFLSYFHFYYSTDYFILPTILQDVINICKELRCAYFCDYSRMSLSLAHNTIYKNYTCIYNRLILLMTL